MRLQMAALPILNLRLAQNKKGCCGLFCQSCCSGHLAISGLRWQLFGFLSLMSAKKAAKANAAKGKAALLAIRNAPPAPPEVTNAQVASHLSRMHEALKTIKSHPIFGDAAKLDALGINDGGSQAAFSQADCTRVLSGGSPGVQYKCGANSLWQDMLWLANHRVPINMAQIETIQKFQLVPHKPPPTMPFITTVALDGADMKVLQHKGALARLSPPEPQHALVLTLEYAINVAKVPDDVLMAWRKVLLTATFHFEVVQPGDDRFWRSQNLRQEAIEHGEVVKLSVRQWIYDVVGFKADKEVEMGKALGSGRVAQFYEEHMKYATGTEKVSTAFVDSAMTIDKRILSLPAAREALEWCDMNFMDKKNPFYSIYVLQAVVDRAQTAKQIAWSMQGLVDHLRMEYIDLGTFTVKKNEGSPHFLCGVAEAQARCQRGAGGQLAATSGFGARACFEDAEGLCLLRLCAQNGHRLPRLVMEYGIATGIAIAG